MKVLTPITAGVDAMVSQRHLPTRGLLVPLLTILASAPTDAQVKSAVKPNTSDFAADAPRVLDLSLNDGQVITWERTVRLRHTVTGNPTHYRAGEHPQLAGAQWRAYDTSPTLDLSPENGSKMVYFQVRRGEASSEIAVDQISLSNPLVTRVTVQSNSGNTDFVSAAVPSPDNTVGAVVSYELEGDYTECNVRVRYRPDRGWWSCRPGSQYAIRLPFIPGTAQVSVQARGPHGESNVVVDEILVEPMTYTGTETEWLGISSGHPLVVGECGQDPGEGRIRGITADLVKNGAVRRFYGDCIDLTAKAQWEAGTTTTLLGWGEEHTGFYTMAPHPEPFDLEDFARLWLGPGLTKFDFHSEITLCPNATWVSGVTAHFAKEESARAIVGLTLRCRRGITIGWRYTGTLTDDEASVDCPEGSYASGLSIIADWTIRGLKLHCRVPVQ